ncbi:S-type pyocin domain-containing protein [Pseudomonas syringae]|nr:S-type pyocin domain-containing protein [Pseudomonas syringae]
MQEDLRRWEEREEARRLEPPIVQQCTFAKSLMVPRGQACYPSAKAPFEGLSNYGDFAVLSTAEEITDDGATLHFIGGSVDALTLSGRLGKGALSLVRTVPVAVSGAGAAAIAGAAGSSVAGGLLAGTVAMLIPNWSLAPDAAFYTREDFADLTTATTGVRINIKYLPEQSVSAFGVYTGANRAWRSVPLIAATGQGEQLVADMGDGIGLIWTPAAGTRDKPAIPALEGAPQLPGPLVYPEAEQAERIYKHPVLEQDFRDAIIWFPTRPELSPIYLSLSVRNAPGVVTGKGEDVIGIWLAGAGQGLGVPIPTWIADKLRGREFSSFDLFRKAFWGEVANDSALSSQFTTSNLAALKKGYAPVTTALGQAGKRMSFELHHVDRVADGGPIYDVDNIRVTTPKNHIDIHRELK